MTKLSCPDVLWVERLGYTHKRRLDFHHMLTVSRTNATAIEYSTALHNQLRRASRCGIRLIIWLKKRNSIIVAPICFKFCMKIGFHETQCMGLGYPFSSCAVNVFHHFAYIISATVMRLRYQNNRILGQVYVSGGSSGGLRGLEHPPRSKFRLQRELTGVINSFSSAKTHCGEPTRSDPITRARSITTTPTMSMSMRIAKARVTALRACAK